RTVKAQNSIEKMLCHQMAAVHNACMNLLIRVDGMAVRGFGQLQFVDIVRLTNGAARLFDCYQTSCLMLQKLKSGGKQHVVVQYQQQVNVSKGGQAVVAAKVNRRGSREREDDRKRPEPTACDGPFGSVGGGGWPRGPHARGFRLHDLSRTCAR